MKLSDYLILAGLAALLFFAVRYAYRHRKDNSCGGNCSSCPYSGNCRKTKKKRL